MKKLQKFLLGVCSVALCMSAVALASENTETVSVSADTVSTWEMVDGASIRTSAPSGIRFTARISESDYAALMANDADVSFGMVIMPYSYVAQYGDADTVFDANTNYTFSESDTTKVRVLHDSVAELTTKKNGYYYFNAALTNIAESNYEKEFYARAYYSDGTNYYFTPDNGTDNVRSVSYVAQKALEDHYNTASTTSYSAATVATMTDYITQFETISNGSVTLTVADAADVTSIAVDGTVVTPTATSENTVTLETTLGRHKATITTAKASYDIPFVSATYVIDSNTALANMYSNMQQTASSKSAEYLVLACDIDYKNEKLTASAAISSWYGKFDGYGHTISNLELYNPTNQQGFLCVTFYGQAMDLVFNNVLVKNGGHGGVLCANLGHKSSYGSFGQTVENVVVIGSNDNSTNAGLIGHTINALAKIKNCIVIDKGEGKYLLNGTYGGTTKVNRSALGGIVPNEETLPTVENTLVATTGIAVLLKSDKTDVTSSYGVTKVDSEAAITAAQLSAFATAAGENSSWTFNTTTGELSLMGNVVFTVSPNNNL